jgi:hypothetical protein
MEYLSVDALCHIPISELIRNYESYKQVVGLLGRGISPLQSRYLLRTTQTQNAYIHASSRVRTHDPGVRTGEDISCLKYARPP